MAEVSWATIENVTSFQIEAAKDSNNGSIELQTTPGTYVDISDQFTDGQATPLMMRTITGITSISGVRLNNNGANAQPRFSKIIVNGELLIDANIQDTVVDTPVKNYAILNSQKSGTNVVLSNGSLNLRVQPQVLLMPHL